jgi:hypothetical protein
MALLSPELMETINRHKHDLNAKIHTPLGTIIAYHVW